jgi:hypothetical protein
MFLLLSRWPCLVDALFPRPDPDRAREPFDLEDSLVLCGLHLVVVPLSLGGGAGPSSRPGGWPRKPLVAIHDPDVERAINDRRRIACTLDERADPTP